MKPTDYAQATITHDRLYAALPGEVAVVPPGRQAEQGVNLLIVGHFQRDDAGELALARAMSDKIREAELATTMLTYRPGEGLLPQGGVLCVIRDVSHASAELFQNNGRASLDSVLPNMKRCEVVATHARWAQAAISPNALLDPPAMTVPNSTIIPKLGAGNVTEGPAAFQMHLHGQEPDRVVMVWNFSKEFGSTARLLAEQLRGHTDTFPVLAQEYAPGEGFHPEGGHFVSVEQGTQAIADLAFHQAANYPSSGSDLAENPALFKAFVAMFTEKFDECEVAAMQEADQQRTHTMASLAAPAPLPTVKEILERLGPFSKTSSSGKEVVLADTGGVQIVASRNNYAAGLRVGVRTLGSEGGPYLVAGTNGSASDRWLRGAVEQTHDYIQQHRHEWRFVQQPTLAPANPYVLSPEPVEASTSKVVL